MIRAALLFALLVSAACGDALAPAIRVQEQRAKWENADIATYILTVRRSCECLHPEMTGPVVVSVRDGVIESRVYEDGTPVPSQYASSFPDVPGLFAIIEDAIQRNAARLNATYHPAYGVPLSFFIDYNAGTVDDEVGYTVSLELPEFSPD